MRATYATPRYVSFPSLRRLAIWASAVLLGVAIAVGAVWAVEAQRERARLANPLVGQTRTVSPAPSCGALTIIWASSDDLAAYLRTVRGEPATMGGSTYTPEGGTRLRIHDTPDNRQFFHTSAPAALQVDILDGQHAGQRGWIRNGTCLLTA